MSDAIARKLRDNKVRKMNCLTLIAGTELLLVDQAGTSKVMTINQLMSHLGNTTQLQQQIQTLSQELAALTRPDLYMDFNQNIIDDTGNTVWTNEGGCGFTASPDGFALSKNADQPGILCNDSGLNFSTNDFSIEIRFLMNSFIKNYACLLASGMPGFGATATFIMVYGENTYGANKKRVAFGGGSIGNPTIQSNIIVTNQWYHLGVTRRGNMISMYLDRVLQEQAYVSNPINFCDGGTMIGYNGWDGSLSYLDGKIDAIRIVRGRALRTEEFVL